MDEDRNLHRDVAPCPGCGETIGRHVIACKGRWRLIPGALKASLGNATDPRARKSVINRMRESLR
jgi:hypothetical protein